MGMTGFQQWAYRQLGRAAKPSADANYQLKLSLERSHTELLPDAYLAYVWMSTILTLIGCVVGLILLVAVYILVSDIPIALLLFLGFLFVVLPFIIYILTRYGPAMKASSRGKEIDAYISYAANFFAAMSAANASLATIFQSLARHPHVYGTISEDAAYMYRDIVVLGMDIITALKRGIRRSPSARFQDLLQGIVSTITSGGGLNAYFQNKAKLLMRENRQEQRDFLEFLAVMAESYVVVAVAFPIFLMVIMVIMMWVSGGGFKVQPVHLFLVIFILLPIIHGAYIALIKISTPKG